MLFCSFYLIWDRIIDINTYSILIQCTDFLTISDSIIYSDPFKKRKPQIHFIFAFQTKCSKYIPYCLPVESSF